MKRFTSTHAKFLGALAALFFAFQLNANTIDGNIWKDNNGNGIQDTYEVGMKDIYVGIVQAGADGLWDTEDDEVLDFAQTDSDGYYAFDVLKDGEYAVKLYDFSFPDAIGVSPMHTTDDVDKDSDIDPATNMSEAFLLADGARDHLSNIDAGLRPQCGGVYVTPIIGYDQLIPKGLVPDELVLLQHGINTAFYNVEYVWLQYTEATGWEEIPNSNAPTYQPGSIFVDTYFRLCQRVTGCEGYLESNIILIEVGGCIAAILADSWDACLGEPTEYTADDDTEFLSYTWTVNGPGSPSFGTGQSFTTTWNAVGEYSISLTATGPNDCTYTNTKKVTVEECNAQGCCDNGQDVITICYQPAGVPVCNITVPCGIIADIHVGTGLYSCVPCPEAPICTSGTGTIFFRPDGSETTAEDIAMNGGEFTFLDTNVKLGDDTNIFPNPATETATVNFYSPISFDVNIQVYNIQSKLLQTTNVQSVAGDNQVELNLSDLPTGMHLVVIQTPNERITKKLMKSAY